MRRIASIFVVVPLLAVAACGNGGSQSVGQGSPAVAAAAAMTTAPVTVDSAATAAVAKRYVEASAKGLPAMLEMFTERVEWHQPGGNRFSGTHVGGAAVGEMFGAQMAATSGTLVIKPTGAPMVNGSLFTLPVHFSAKRDGAEMAMDGVDVFRVEGDRIAEVWLFSADQKAEDAFWGAP